MEELKAEVEQIKRQLEEMAQQQSQKPLLSEEQFLDVKNITSLFKTITSATELTNATAIGANTIYEQLFIDTTTATKKLYIYDEAGKLWRSCTIA